MTECAPGPEAGLFLTNLRVRGWMDYDNLTKHREDLIMVSLLGTRGVVARLLRKLNGYEAQSCSRYGGRPFSSTLRSARPPRRLKPHTTNNVVTCCLMHVLHYLFRLLGVIV